MSLMLALWIGWLVLIALDAKRYHWSRCPARSSGRGLRAALPRLLSRRAHLQGEQLRGAGREDPEGARPPRGDHRALRLCAPSDVCRRSADLGRRAAPPRLMVGLGRGVGHRPAHRRRAPCSRSACSRPSSTAMRTMPPASAIASCRISGRSTARFIFGPNFHQADPLASARACCNTLGQGDRGLAMSRANLAVLAACLLGALRRRLQPHAAHAQRLHPGRPAPGQGRRVRQYARSRGARLQGGDQEARASAPSLGIFSRLRKGSADEDYVACMKGRGYEVKP